ncbi:unnamed protein product [Durusdinium trenchii]|uniref:Fungal lipase-type domain-containing protein n=1 Tax=Durusdinium trenchii TaxID=1381693 RepID=A0ABP0Q0R4_9DINO
MLRSLSTAALEHAQTRGGFTRSSSGDLSLSEEDDEDLEEERDPEKLSLCFRLGLFIGYIIPTWGHLSLANVGRSWAAGAFALWHCFLFLNSTILIFINCCSAILRCYIQWFSEMHDGYNPFSSKDREAEGHLGQGSWHVITHFFGAFFRSYILMSVTGDVMRFTYLLCVDAWRPDAFEAYRRLWVGDAWKELAIGQLYIQSWSVCLNKCQKAMDIIVQVFLYVSLDLVPILLFILVYDTPMHGSVVCEVCMAIGCFHIFCFYFLFIFGEAWLKISRFRWAWRAAKDRVTFARSGSSGIHIETETVWMTGDGTQFLSMEAEARSLCVLCCTIFHWLEYLLPVALALVTCVLGLVLDRYYLTEVGAVAASMLFFVMLGTHEALDHVANQQKCTPLWIRHMFRQPEILQRWGERWCRLGFSVQKRQRYPFAVSLGFTALVFGGFKLMMLTYSCMGLMLFLCLRLLWMRVEGAGGWFWAFLESFIEFILLNVLIITTTRNAMRDGAVVLLLCVMRQFGYQREINSGERVRLASMIVLGSVQVLLLTLVCFALDSASDDKWSQFGPYMGSKAWYNISSLTPVQEELADTLPMCLVRFPRGMPHSAKLDFNHSLSLADFGLMASLTYEPQNRVAEGCAHYFPEWHMEPRPPSVLDEDWVRFVMFTSDTNSTTVIAVRGTLTALDVLHDVTLWLVPAVLQLFNYIGPDVADGSWGISMSRLSQLIPLAPIRKQTTYDSVFLAVEYMLEHYPNRLYYLTGHSLGGGIAKLVELQLKTRIKPLTVAFAAPGVEHAARVLFPSGISELGNELATLTVEPNNDVISKIDVQIGNTLNAPCDGRALTCHSIYRTLWGIFQKCGSMTRRELRIPCGWSPEAPC